MPVDRAAWDAFVGAAPRGDPAREAVFEAWPDESGSALRRIEASELEKRLAESRVLVRTAEPYLRWMVDNLGRTTVAGITDPDGIVLHAAGAQSLCEEFGLSPGQDCSEKACRNGAGRCLALRRPVVMVIGTVRDAGPHGLLQDCVCTACPVKVYNGHIIGALDVRSCAADAMCSRLSIVGHVATLIGAGVLVGNPPAFR
jgi:transcriptional regulator of acetoin/glycerol metabolism